MKLNEEKLETYFEKLEKLNGDKMMELVSKYLDDEDIEVLCNHIEDFYGVDDDEEIGMLAQIMVSGYVMGKEVN